MRGWVANSERVRARIERRGSFSPIAIPLVALVLLASVETSAQRLTGNMKGRVVDPAGDIVPDSVVTIAGRALMVPELSTTTNEQGEFRFAGLDPGEYEVRADLAGFGSVVQQNVRVSVGATTELTLVLQPRLAEVLVVTAEPPTVDTEANRVAVNFTTDTLENIPNDRSVGAVFNFTPAVTGDSARGSTVRANAHQYDGVDITDPTVGTPFVSFNYDTLEEIQVETGGHPAEYGQVTGALINVVTKSGGNELSGEANFYFQNSDLNSKNGEDITERFPELQSGELLERIDTQAQLGGPIAQNRAWFFGAYRYLGADRTVVGFNDEKGDPVPTNEKQKFALGKVSLQLNPDHRIIAGLHWDSLELDNREADALTPPESTRTQTGSNWVPNVEWTGIFAENTFAQTRFTLVDNAFDLLPKNDEPGCLNVDTGVLGCSAGIEDLNQRTRKQFMASLSHYREMGGTHDLKFGFAFEDSDDFRDFTANRGLFHYTVYDRAGNEVPYYSVVYQDPPTTEAITRTSFYAQDSWSIHDRLTLNLGVRVDSSEGWFPEQQLPNGETQPETRDVISQTDVSPRIGAAFAVGDYGRGVIRASYSRYVDALITQYFSSVNGNAISGQVRAACAGPLGFLCRPGDGELSSLTLQEFGSLNTIMDDDLELPKTDEINVGFEWAIVPSISFSVNYVYKKALDLIEDVETRDFIPLTAHDPGDTELDEHGNVVDVAGPQTFTLFDPDLDSPSEYFITNPELAKRDYRGLELVLTRRLVDSWQLLGSFVVSESEGLVGTSFGETTSISGLFDDPNSLINAEGKLTLNRKYQFKLLGTYQAPYGISVSGYYRFLAGRPYNRTALFTEYDSNADGSNDTPFDGGPILIDAETRGLRELDDIHLVDLRVDKEFPFPSWRLGFILDAFNLFNVDTVTSKRTRTSADGNWGEPLSFIGPRELRVAVRVVF